MGRPSEGRTPDERRWNLQLFLPMVHRLVTVRPTRDCCIYVTQRNAAQVPRLGVQYPIELANIVEAQDVLGPLPTARRMEKLGISTNPVGWTKGYD